MARFTPLLAAAGAAWLASAAAAEARTSFEPPESGLSAAHGARTQPTAPPVQEPVATAEGEKAKPRRRTELSTRRGRIPDGALMPRPTSL
ncbi:MAG: hypothetical protein GC189_05955 [Alphaproteobacteria bacterium]|nr:hypothetical protein [Alphaproteobacteria bacterium]